MIVATIITIVAIVFLGLTFGNVELDIIEHSIATNRKWHWFKGMFQGVIYIAIGYPIYGFHWKLILFVIMLLSLTVIVFNPIINMVRNRKDFFYIAKNGIEGFFYNTPKLYYFINVILAMGIFLTLNFILE